MLTTQLIIENQAGTMLPCLIKYTNCAKYSSNTPYITAAAIIHKISVVIFSFVLILKYVAK